jgi:hypothetical protein
LSFEPIDGTHQAHTGFELGTGVESDIGRTVPLPDSWHGVAKAAQETFND